MGRDVFFFNCFKPNILDEKCSMENIEMMERIESGIGNLGKMDHILAGRVKLVYTR